MDQLTAYRILRLEPGCSLEEIKAAYAALSKEFHPEEQPEEFQRIHEAYRLLARGSRRQRSSDESNYDPEFHEVLRRTEERLRAEQRQQSLDFEEVLQQTEEELAEGDAESGFEEALQNEEENRSEEALQNEEENRSEEVLQNKGESRSEEVLQEETPESRAEYRFEEVLQQAQENISEGESPEKYDFESALRQNELNERERLHKLCQKALVEMELLMGPQYRNNAKIYHEFFEKVQYQEILRNPEFLAEFCRMLEESQLKKEIYHYIVDVYRLRGADPDSLKPEIADLYRVLERKGGTKKKKNGWAFVIPVAFLAVIRSGMKAGVRAARITHNSGAFIVACILVAILCFFIWIYRKLTKKHSSIFAQFIIALCLTLSQFIMLGAEAYAPLIGVEGSDTIGFLLFALGCIWLIVLLIVAVVQKIRKL